MYERVGKRDIGVTSPQLQPKITKTNVKKSVFETGFLPLLSSNILFKDLFSFVD